MMRRNREPVPPLPGLGCELEETGLGTIVRGRALGDWEHPWSIAPVYEENEEGKGEWRGYVVPGFVNGRDAYIAMPVDWPDGMVPEGVSGSTRDVALTDEEAPYLVFGGWRNPLAPQGVASTLDGKIVAQKPEGYPPFFEELGVKAPAKGGDVSQIGALEAQADEVRSRELRAVDVVLTQPRIGSRMDIRVGVPLVDAQTEFLATVYTSDLVRSTGGRARLQVVSKYVPLREDQSLAALYGLLLRAGDAQMDQLKLATIWMVSPAGASSEDVPDETWEPYVQNFLFWNVNHATRVVVPTAPNPPLRITTGLAGGLADFIGNGLLSMINDMNAEMEAFFAGADTSGQFWSV